MDWSTLSSREFFAIVERLPFYRNSLMHARALELDAKARGAADGEAALAALIADGVIERR